MGALLRLLSVTHLMSPEIKDGIHNALDKMSADAKATPNPIDDIAVGCLITLASIVGLY